ncbi:NSm [Orthotospovirus tomatozonae]|uniref:NSm n=1 Tax=Tomato zonate spot virus TaxID=460926 RepID=B1NK05_9VIRU|nr:NSm [Tomato zonate spot virus]WAB75054.1 NSm [Orthotospovirus tomatozonae]ABU49103.1 NSm [Tomato zonate spot virus]AGE10332.1 non-structural movement protein [Tomato zonate spot virus]AKC03653.1 nonstructural movement protein [Tomato zonate spot virus]AKC03655.1 nonstructural movement protein [Tomato zonate spot virus]
MSRITNVLSSFIPTNNSNNELVPAIKNENDKSIIARQISKRDVNQALENKAKSFNGKQYVSGMDSSVLGSYSSGNEVEATSDDLLSRLVVEQSTHLSNWKNDSLVGNGNDKVSFTINIMPTWNSRRNFMHISRLIVWIVPTVPDSESIVKATLIDQNEMTVDKKIIIGKQTSLSNPACFIFHLNWSFPKERNTPKQCFQLNLTSNKKYAKGVSFASVMYSWVKNFCDTPIAAESNTCDVIPINRAKVIKSAALIEACRLMIPKGTSGKQISNQIKKLQTVAEKLALESEMDENESELDIKIDVDNTLDF